MKIINLIRSLKEQIFLEKACSWFIESYKLGHAPLPKSVCTRVLGSQ